MIKEIIAVFKGDSLLDRAFKRTFEMLDLTNTMFLEVKDVLRHSDTNQINININDEDLKVNKYEREVRKDVFQHLVMAGTDALPSDLVLVSIVIDVERIGDLSKNIVEIAQAHKGKLVSKVFDEKIDEIENAVAENFSQTIDTFKNANEDLGRKIMMEYKWVNRSIDEILMSLINNEDKDLKSGSAAALAIYLRQIKRINSHLMNIASSVVNPFHRIGFKPKKKK